jgi:UDP-N-acetylmuramoyl-L-alanyl-D-glutamate--2,6-diaminopimelate ligase
MMALKQQTGWSLRDLLDGMAKVDPAQDRAIGGLASDSRKLRAGDLFLALAGTTRHGQQYISDALQAGAAAVATAQPLESLDARRRNVPIVTIEHLEARVGVIADRFFGQPSKHLLTFGVTGTNGKTSVSFFIAQALTGDPDFGPCEVIGTVGYGPVEALAPASHTTPDPIALHGLLAEMRGRGAQAVALEASSHALDQHRIAGLAIDAAIFTNLSRDHLDYHGDMDAYGKAKRRLFALPGLKHAAINFDDDFGRYLLDRLPAGVEGAAYSLTHRQFHGHDRDHPIVLGDYQPRMGGGLTVGITSPWGQGVLESGLIGSFNAANLLAVLTTLLQVGMPFDRALNRLAGVRGAPGRLESFGGNDRPLAVVDYSHTPDALRNALQALRPLCRGQLLCVFGCGGNRDRGKRALMGAAAEALADRVILTNDNPRSEPPEAIVADILSGMAQRRRVVVDYDRAAAIAFALSVASPGDIVLIAGKGHETYQEIGGERLPFSDREVVTDLIGSG